MFISYVYVCIHTQTHTHTEKKNKNIYIYICTYIPLKPLRIVKKAGPGWFHFIAAPYVGSNPDFDESSPWLICSVNRKAWIIANIIVLFPGAPYYHYTTIYSKAYSNN